MRPKIRHSLALTVFGSLLMTLTVAVGMTSGCAPATRGDEGRYHEFTGDHGGLNKALERQAHGRFEVPTGQPFAVGPNATPLERLGAQVGRRNLVVSCADPTSCSPSVGVMLWSSPSGTFSCSAWVVGPQTLMVNKHCLLDHNDQLASSCESVHVIFPQTASYPLMDSQCASLGEVTPDAVSKKEPNGSRDYLLLRMREPLAPRPVLPLSSQGVPDQMPLVAHVIKPEASTDLTLPARFTLEARQCTAVMRSLAMVLFVHPLSPTIGIVGCDIQEGNSAGPLVDASGQVRAMINGYIKLTDLDVLDAFEGRKDQKPSAGFATNLACIDAPSVGLKVAGSPCLAKTDLRAIKVAVRNLFPERDADHFSPTIRSLFAQWQKQQQQQQQPTDFDYTLEATLTKVVALAKPSCARHWQQGKLVELKVAEIRDFKVDRQLRPLPAPSIYEYNVSFEQIIDRGRHTLRVLKSPHEAYFGGLYPVPDCE